MKKKFVKAVSLAMSFVLAVSILVGCGAKDETKDEQGRTIISIGSWPDQPGEALDVFEARKERYEKENPDAVIEPDLWRFDRKTFYAKATGGQLPTVYNAQFTEVPEIISSELSADLTDVLKKRGYEGMINPAVLEVVSDNEGRIMAFPNGAYLLGLAYNVDMFKAAGLMEEDGTPKQPKDWNEVVEFAVKIKEATGKPGIILPTANRSGGWIFTSIAWSFGVDFMEKGEDGKWKATFNTPEAAAALQWYKDLKWKYDVLPANSLIDGTEWYKNLGTGNGAMTVTAGDYPSRVLSYGMKPEQIGMMGIPAGPERHVTLLGGEIVCLAEDATEEQIDAGVRWLEMVTNYKLTDEYKKTTEATIQQYLSEGRHVGIKNMSIWSDASESVQWYNSYIDANANANINHVKPYNDFVADCPAEVQAEEPVCAQELYSILDNCIQEVLINKDADCAKLLEKACSDFQVNYLDNLTY